MTSTAIGNGPLTFTDSNGRQVSIPLSALKFQSGLLSVDVTKWQPYAGYPAEEKALITNLLTNLVSGELVVQSAEVALKPAIVLKASDPLGVHNEIKVEIQAGSLNVDPTQTTFTLKVTETDTYNNLKVDTIFQTLGKVVNSTLTPGSQPGLVHVKGDGPYLLPNTLNTPKFLADDPSKPNEPAFLEISDGANGIAFTLVAKRAGVDGKLTEVSITPGVDANTFNLTCTWTKISSGLSLATLTTELTEFSYMLTLSYPSSGTFSVPQAGTYTLSGDVNGILPSTIVYAAS